MKKTFLSALLFSTMLAGSANAQTIIEALAQTYKTNPELQAQRAYLRSVDENVSLAKSGYRPNVYLQGGLTAGEYDSNVTQRDSRTGTSVAARVSQPLFSGFQTVNSVKSADSLVKSEQNNLYTVEQNILLAAATAYLDVVRDAAIVKLQKNNEELLKKRLDETQERFNVGEVTKTDVAQSRARYSRAQSDRIAAEGDLEASKAVYQRIIGAKPEILTEPTDLKQALPKNFDEALNYAITNNYEIKQAKNLLNSRTYDVAARNGELLPSLTLDGVASKSRTDAQNMGVRKYEEENYEASLNMTIPLYNSGESRARIRQSKYQKWQAQESVLVAERQVISVVTSAWEYLMANEARIRSIQEQINANEIALEGVQKEEYLGNRTVLDVLDAYQELLNSNVEEVKARRDYYVSGMNVFVAMGKLTAQDLNLNVELYDAEKHYKQTKNKWLSLDIDE